MRESFGSVAAGGIRQDSFPMRLFNLAKKWTWDPAALDFSRDLEDWRKLTEPQRDLILRLTSLFQAGKEAVTIDLLPLLRVIAAEGRLEEEMYLTSFLFEEAKHVEFFRRFVAVVGAKGDLNRYHSPNYRRLFYEEVPAAMGNLGLDPSPHAQIQAAVTYNLVVEGLLAEIGYHATFTALRANGIMPGLCEGIARIKTDESRHIAWGMYHCSRLVAVDPSLMEAVYTRAGELLVPAVGVVNDLFDAYDPMPFTLPRGMLVEYALDQYQRRMKAIEGAIGQTPEDLLRWRPSDLGTVQ